MILPLQYWLITFMAAMAGPVPFSSLYYRISENRPVTGLCWFVGYLFITLPLSRYFANKYGTLKKIKAK